MKNNVLILTGCLIVALMVSCVTANTQTGVATQVGGVDNTQTVTNNDNQQSGSTTQIGGSGNSASTTNVNGNIYNGANSVSNNQQVMLVFPQKNSNYELSLDNLPVSTALNTLYLGEVVPVDVGYVPEGQTYYFGWTSSVPVLVYAVSNEEVNTATNSVTGAPTYDDVYRKWDHNGVYHYPIQYASNTINDGFSRNNNVSFTAPEPGSYSFVIDTRPAVSRYTTNVLISDDTVDIAYTLTKDGYHKPSAFQREVIGTHSEFPINKTPM